MYPVKQQAYPNMSIYIQFLWSCHITLDPFTMAKPRYCWEECGACSWVFCKPTAEPKAKACSGEASHVGEHQRIDSSPWGLRHQVTRQTVIWTSEYSVRTKALHVRHTPFIQVKQDYWNDRQVCNLGTKSWFRPIKLQVTESSP